MKKEKELQLGERYRFRILVAFIILALGDIFLIEFVNDWVILVLFTWGFWIIWLYRWQNRFLVLLSLATLLPAVFFLLIKLPYVAEKFALWSYFSLAVAVLREIWGRVRENG